MAKEAEELTSRPQGSLQDILKAAPKAHARVRCFWLLGGFLIVLALFFLFYNGKNNSHGEYLTEEAVRGNLVVTVSATGTLQPIKTVDVGSEQSGTLAQVLVQENDLVKKGQVLAQLETDKFKDAVAKSQAVLSAAEAVINQNRATVEEAGASLSRLERVWKISGGKVPSDAEMDVARATLRRAVASEASARAAYAQAQAALKTDENNLAKAAIRSPIEGVVLSRKIEPGQTVIAAMTSPTLFILAEDLAHMELQVKIDEADVGSVKTGQLASFTVSAWPGRTFQAQIRRVNLGSVVADNVVTYKALLETQNLDLALRPGMTATASIVTAQRENVLLVPNTALRFVPPETEEKQRNGGFLSRILPHPPSEPKQQKKLVSQGMQQVWVLDKNEPKALSVITGVTNGRLTEITKSDLKPGMRVITDYQAAKK